MVNLINITKVPLPQWKTANFTLLKMLKSDQGILEMSARERLNMSKIARPRPSDTNYSFLSPEISEDAKNMLSEAMAKIACYHELQNAQSEEEAFRIRSVVEDGIKELQEVAPQYQEKIIIAMNNNSCKEYYDLFILLNERDYQSVIIELLSSFIYPASCDNPRIVEILDNVATAPFFNQILFSLFSQQNTNDQNSQKIIRHTLTYISNLISISTKFRNSFINDYMPLVDKLPKMFNRWKLQVFLSLLDGPLIGDENLERFAIMTAVKISMKINRFKELLRPLVILVAESTSTSREIILKEHLINEITIISENGKNQYREYALEILADCCFYGTEMLNEMISYGTTNAVISVLQNFENSLREGLVRNALDFIINWFASCDGDYKISNHLIKKLQNVNFSLFLNSSKYHVKRGILIIISHITILGSFETNICVLNPDLVKQMCNIAESCNEDFLQIIIKIFSTFIVSSEGHDEIFEVANLIKSELDISNIEQISEENHELNEIFQSFVEKVNTLVPDE